MYTLDLILRDKAGNGEYDTSIRLNFQNLNQLCHNYAKYKCQVNTYTTVDSCSGRTLTLTRVAPGKE